MATQDALRALCERFPDEGFEPRPLVRFADGTDAGQLWVRVRPQRLLEVARFLKTDARCRFEQLTDVTCVDYLHFPEPPSEERFGVIYALLSITHNHRLWLKAFVSDPSPSLPSVTGVWRGAEWPEREVFDLFGVRFEGHPDLRRILCPDWFTEHPLRKDYPLTGRGEREAFRVISRESA